VTSARGKPTIYNNKNIRKFKLLNNKTKYNKY
jgi:hypothetical protein